jgi:hypothetical protein
MPQLRQAASGERVSPVLTRNPSRVTMNRPTAVMTFTRGVPKVVSFLLQYF